MTRTRARVPVHTPSEAEAFTAQLSLVGAFTLVAAATVALVDVVHRSDEIFVGATLALAWVTIATAPLRITRGRSAATVALVDVVLLVALAYSTPVAGFTTLLVFPVMWASRTVAGPQAVAVTLTAALGVWLPPVLDRLGVLGQEPRANDLSMAAAMSVTLVLVAGVSRRTARRVSAQGALLRRQTTMLEAALERVRREERTVREALDAVHFAVVTFTRDGTILSTNHAARAAATRLDLTPETPIGAAHVWWQADGTTPTPPELHPFVRAAREDGFESTVHWVGHAAGPQAAFSISSSPLEPGPDAPLVMVAREVTAEMHALQARDDLVTSMSHELRTPLSSILGYLDLAMDDSRVPAETRDMLGIALKNAERMLALVSDLLAARSTDVQEIRLNPAPCDLAALVRDSLDAVRPLAAEQIIAISLDVPETLPAVADASRLRHVVDNLMSNAIKYNRIGGRITVSLQPVDDRAVLTVSDTGRGMRPEEIDRLFERFYRAPSVRNTTIHGSGIGLNLAREIVVRHGGTIDVASEPGKGTTLTVIIPLEDPA